MFDRLRRIPDGEAAPSNAVSLRSIVVGAALLIICLIVVWLISRGSIYYITQGYVDDLVEAFGLNRHLGNAIFWLSFVVLSYFIALVFSVNPISRRVGIGGVTTLLVAHSLALWHATKDKPFARGLVSKCYVVTRQEIRYGDLVGKDPTTGLECKPVTPEIVEKIERYKKGSRPIRISSDKPIFFDPRTGNPITWYVNAPNDRIEVFDLMGFHPETGVELRPITADVVAKWKEQQALASRKPPARVHPSVQGPWFDPVDGRSLLWFRRASDGVYEFFDREGFDPQSGAPLERVTADNLDAIRRFLTDSTSKKCFVLTPQAVEYRSETGIDKDTGRQCRLITTDLLVRLKEYEQGKRPSLIDGKLPTMFDPRSGEPVVWYWKSSDGKIELYDLMGFHPRTGDELLPITRVIAEEFDGQSRAPKMQPRAPEKIDPSAFKCFDAMTGKPRCWFWKSASGAIEFYDGPGFHPKFGEPLAQITKEVIQKLEDEAAFRAKQLQEEQAAREREKEAQNVQAAKEAREREEKRINASRLAKQCDDLAANPNDRNRVGSGVPLGLMKVQGKEAIAACEEAVRQAPEEPRFSYQLARALSFTDRARAFRILEGLVAKGYPAAHDNLGWMLHDDRKNVAGALQMFRRGVSLGDPDSMVSLGQLIGQNGAFGNASETPISFFAQACHLGHQRACVAAEEENEKERQRAREIVQQQQTLELFKGILQSLPVGRR